MIRQQAGLEPVGDGAARGDHHLDDVEPGRQRGVELLVDLLRVDVSRASPISRYSASLADPVGAAPAYEIRGCGLKPDE